MSEAETTPEIDQALNDIFGGAREMTGASPPYEMEINREYIAMVRKEVDAALRHLPASVLRHTSARLRVLANLRANKIELEETYYQEEQEAQQRPGPKRNKKHCSICGQVGHTRPTCPTTCEITQPPDDPEAYIDDPPSGGPDHGPC